MLNTLKDKMSLIFMGLVILIAFVGSVSVFNLIAIEKSINGIMTNNYGSIQSCEPMIACIGKQNTAILDFIHNNDSSSIKAFDSQSTAFKKYYAQELTHISEKGEREADQRILSDYTQYCSEVSALHEMRIKIDESAAFDYYHSKILPTYTSINEDLNKIILLNQDSMFKNKNKTSQGVFSSLMIVLIISLCSAVLGFFVSIYLLKRFLSPLQLMTQTVRSVKSSNFGIRINVNTNDEIGELATEFNVMLSRLEAYRNSTKGQLLAERNRSVAIMKSISDPLLVLDGNFNVQMINKACEAFFKISENQAAGRRFTEVVFDRELNDIIENMTKNKADIKQKLVRLQRGGQTLYFNAAVTVLRQSHINGYIILLHNVTEIKELEQAKTDFTATISHEFKTPLTAVIMGASMMENEDFGKLNSEQADIIETIQENAQRISDFVSELLELSRIESGKAVYFREPCLIASILDNSLSQYEVPAKRSGITIINNVARSLPLVFVDYEKITWVFNNLLSNAVKYTKSGGTITISAQANKKYMVVSIEDTGEGIPPEFINRVFDKFVQVKSHDLEVRGTGLGLSVAKDIITAHDGAIAVESALGKGSKFTFYLPVYREDN